MEETAGKEQIANMYDYCYETTDKTGEKESHAFQWITNIKLTERNLEEMITAGRGRWKALGVRPDEYNMNKIRFIIR